MPPMVGGKWKCEDYLPPMGETPGGQITGVLPPMGETLGANYYYLPPLWGANEPAAGEFFGISTLKINKFLIGKHVSQHQIRV